MTENQMIARTGRVQNWLDDPTDSLPVSCTITVVEDSMWGINGITDSWLFSTYALQNGAGVAIHLYKLRPKGSVGSTGKIASGPNAFMPIYSAINDAVKKGNRYKSGAIVLHQDLDHPDILDFLTMGRDKLQWVKRCVSITQETWDAAPADVRNELLKGIARGDIWLGKIDYDKNGNRLHLNVCLEVRLLNRGTCLLQHINVSGGQVEDIPKAFADGMTQLVNLHGMTGVDQDGWYRSPGEDRQVGLGMIGLANLLALEGVTYAQFADALELYLGSQADLLVTPAANRIVKALAEGIERAAEIANAAGMERAFSIAPTASCSFRYKDRAGNTTAPEIAPPIGRVVDRDSSSFGVTTVSYGDVETAEMVGFDTYFRAVNAICELYQRTGLFHGYSFNSWSDCVTYDEAFVQRWLDSPQTSLYYSLQVKQNTQAKDDAMVALDDMFQELGLVNDDFASDDICLSCAE